MGIDSVKAKQIAWHNISKVSERDLEELQGDFRFHHLDYDDIRSETPISKMDPYKHYIFFVFHIPTLKNEKKHVHGEELYIFLHKDGIVTLSHWPISALDAFFERMNKSAKFRNSIMSKGPAYLMYRILMEVFRNALSIVGTLTTEVTRLEEAIESRHEKTVTVDLAHVRRNVLFMRHIIDPQRRMLTSLMSTKRVFIKEDNLLYFDDLQDVLDTIWLTADNLKLIIDGLFDVNEALLSHKTNEIITLLTILSASLMLPTLIAGFYGMNVPWLPFANSAPFITFLYGIGFIGMAIVVVAIVKRRDW